MNHEHNRTTYYSNEKETKMMTETPLSHHELSAKTHEMFDENVLFSKEGFQKVLP